MSPHRHEPVDRDPSDADLLAAYRSGDAEAAAALYRRHHGAALTVARALSATGEGAEDVVAEAWTSVLSAVRAGAGPSFAFRPYLLTAVRHRHYAVSRRDRHAVPAEDLDQVAEPAPDETELRLESSLLAEAFGSLPERWQAVLWHTTIHDEPAETVGRTLGLRPSAVTSLAHRARDGLRKAYLVAHLERTDDPECRTVRDLLPAYDRGRLRARRHELVETHLRTCADCEDALAVLHGLGTYPGALLLPALLGVRVLHDPEAGDRAAAGVLAATGASRARALPPPVARPVARRAAPGRA